LRRVKPKTLITIGLIGKYVEMQDCYKSILEAFIHAGASNETKVNIISIHSEYIDALNVKKIKSLDGILVAPVLGKEELKVR
jgi:CTP synthase